VGKKTGAGRGARRGVYDLIVVGGGPAGTTLATLVKKYAPKRRVLLLEKEKGPCHQVGESLLPGLVPVLKEMGVFEKIDGAGFPRKIGANYIWGKDRDVWENDFNEVNLQEMVERYGEIPPKIEYAWQVRRSVYDEILLSHAEECGVEVERGVLVDGIVEEKGRIAGVTLAGGRGRRLAEFTADCSGQSGFLSKFRRIREFNPALKNVAAYAYFKGARWKYSYTGHPDKTKIFICTVGSGWFWYIPIEKDLVSVGFVTTVAHLKKKRVKDVRALFFEELERCGEIWPLLQGSEQVKDFEGTGQDFFTRSDWSYLNAAASGPGWLAAGDAAVFVDPILSSGVTLAHLAAHRAAYTLLSWWASAPGAELLWKNYDQFCREAAGQYLVLALFWYGNDRCAEEWWGKARELQRASLPIDLSDKSAFVTVSAGLTQHYDRLISTRSVEDEVLTKPAEYPFYLAAFPQDDSPSASPGARAVPRLLYPHETEIVFLPLAQKGLLQPVKRIRFLKYDAADPLQDALNPKKIVTRYHLELLACVDGARTTREVLAQAASRGVPAWWLEGPARIFLKELGVQGVLKHGRA
jgi:flavin-dependent dehydrogenase